MKTLTGHLTAHDKKAIKAIMERGFSAGTVGKKQYYLIQDNYLSSKNYTVKIRVMDRGLIPCPGSALRQSTYTSTFIL